MRHHVYWVSCDTTRHRHRPDCRRHTHPSPLTPFEVPNKTLYSEASARPSQSRGPERVPLTIASRSLAPEAHLIVARAGCSAVDRRDQPTVAVVVEKPVVKVEDAAKRASVRRAAACRPTLSCCSLARASNG